jgi:excisionase family DNA binding protein
MTEAAEIPYLNSVAETCDLLRLKRSKLYQLLAVGRLRSVKAGRRRLIPGSAIHDFVASLTDSER